VGHGGGGGGGVRGGRGEGGDGLTERINETSGQSCRLLTGPAVIISAAKTCCPKIADRAWPALVRAGNNSQLSVMSYHRNEA